MKKAVRKRKESFRKKISRIEKSEKFTAFVKILFVILVAVLIFFAFKRMTGYSINDSNGSYTDYQNRNSKVVCSDSDNGIDFYNYGYVKYKNKNSVYKDRCFQNYIYERYCQKSEKMNRVYLSTKIYLCPNGCVGGKCVE